MKAQDIEWEACFLEPLPDRELERYARRETGYSSAVTKYYSPCPWVVRAFVELNYLIAKLVHISVDLGGKVCMGVTQNNSCRYCFSGQRMLLRIMGLPERQVQQLEQDALTADLDPRERAAVQFGRRLSRANPPLAPVHFEGMHGAGYSDGAILEIALVAACTDFYNRVSTFSALPPQDYERFSERGIVRILLPKLVGHRIRSGWGAGKPDHFAAEVGDVPFAFLLTALEGLPMGRALWNSLEEAWGSDILPRRTKALVFAVVGRALGCAASEQEAARLVQAEGMARADLESVLTHLGGSQLDPIEAQIVPFARETVWYRPAPIQRRVRALQEHLTTPQLLELVGIAALANTVCRLCVVVGER